MALNDVVKFYQLTKNDYDNIDVKNLNAIYFLKDTQQIFLGDSEYTKTMGRLLAVPVSGDIGVGTEGENGKLYYYPDNKSIYLCETAETSIPHFSWTLVSTSSEISTIIDDTSTDNTAASSKAVYTFCEDYFLTKTEKYICSFSGIVEDNIITISEGDLDKFVSMLSTVDGEGGYFSSIFSIIPNAQGFLTQGIKISSGIDGSIFGTYDVKSCIKDPVDYSINRTFYGFQIRQREPLILMYSKLDDCFYLLNDIGLKKSTLTAFPSAIQRNYLYDITLSSATSTSLGLNTLLPTITNAAVGDTVDFIIKNNSSVTHSVLSTNILSNNVFSTTGLLSLSKNSVTKIHCYYDDNWYLYATSYTKKSK